MKEITIYYLINNITNTIYIGQTANYLKRIRVHRAKALNPIKYSNKSNQLYNDIAKYGWNNFTHEAITTTCDPTTADVIEYNAISNVIAYGGNLYNYRRGGKKDPTIYTFVNTTNDIEYSGTQEQFRGEFNCSMSDVCKLANHYLKSTHGWKITYSYLPTNSNV